MYKRDVWGVIGVVPVLYIDVLTVINMQDNSRGIYVQSLKYVLILHGNVYLSMHALPKSGKI